MPSEMIYVSIQKQIKKAQGKEKKGGGGGYSLCINPIGQFLLFRVPNSYKDTLLVSPLRRRRASEISLYLWWGMMTPKRLRLPPDFILLLFLVKPSRNRVVLPPPTHFMCHFKGTTGVL